MKYGYLRWGGLLAVISMLALMPTFSSASYAQTGGVTFPQTGHSLRGGFLTYWQTHGGLAQQGFPITDEYPEINSVDGRTYTTQYFERARFEFHPEQPTQYQVLLGLLGHEVLQLRYPNGLPVITPQIVPGGGSFTFPQTGHTVTGLFLSYWQAHGGLAQQGYPLTEAFYEINQIDGQAYITQYFERARFEYHPEQQDPQFKVLLGLLGDEIHQSKQPNPTPTATPAPPTPTATALQVSQVNSQVSVSAGGNASTAIGCPEGSIVVGGGWGGDTSLDVYNSSISNNGWMVAASNLGSKTQKLSSYALCMRGASGSTVQESASITVAAGATGRTFARCSSGVLTGGGFSKELGINLTAASPARDGWLVAGANNKTVNQKLTAYLICLQGSNLNVSQVSATGSVNGGGTASTTVDCNGGTLVSGGGFDAVTGVNVFGSGSDGNSWQVSGFNLTGATRQLNAYAICIANP